MADFCWDCCDIILGVNPEKNDCKGLCKEGEFVGVLCEGCGFINVDHNGKRISNG